MGLAQCRAARVTPSVSAETGSHRFESLPESMHCNTWRPDEHFWAELYLDSQSIKVGLKMAPMGVIIVLECLFHHAIDSSSDHCM